MTAVRSIIFLFSLSFSPFFQENENDYFTISRPLTGNEEEDLKKKWQQYFNWFGLICSLKSRYGKLIRG